MNPIRVLIADDSALARGLLRAVLAAEPGIEVVGEATNGREAAAMVHELRPNLVSMDLEMPVMGGLEAIEEIMATKAVPILVVSDIADARNACEAIRRGALEVICKPEIDSPSAAEFVAKVRMLATIPVITHLRRRKDAAVVLPAAAPSAVAVAMPASYRRIFAIASSTGGPQALAQILPQLPPGFPSPVLVAQHISDGFAAGMAQWLGGLCRLPVRLGCDGELVLPGTIYIAPSETHMAVTNARRLSLLPRQSGDIYHPNCDVLLTTAANVFGAKAVGVILTGMGHDGAAGLAAIRQAGGTTIAQDEASSVIYGMNGIAVARGAAQRVLALSEIGAALCALAAEDAFAHMSGSWA